MSKHLFTALLFAVTVAFTTAGCSKINYVEQQQPPHIPPDATSEQIRQEINKQKQGERNLLQLSQVGELDAALKMGERNLDWLKHINSKLQSGEPLSFSSKGTMSGYPMDKPNRYSKKIAMDRYTAAVREMPREMHNVLVNGQPFTDKPPVDLQTYLNWGLKIDKVYQTAARWQMMQPYLAHLSNRRAEDVRGFYFLSVEPDLENKLRNLKTQTQAEQKRLEQWLILLCFNSEKIERTCKDKLAFEKTGGRVWDFYRKYNPRGQRLFNSYFDITSKRSDISWNENVLVYPFRDPKNDPVETYLKVNIEDEWRWNGWSLILKFTPDAATHVEFVAGTTPHVNGLAGSKITMDANAPLTEWDVQWTIRHEFGHNLGFPDCYIEFYESATSEIVNYQIDTSNLMCSRMGKLQEKHYLELKEAYSRP